MSQVLRSRRGWIVWSISKVGVLMTVLVIFLMLYMVYKYTSCINASDSANQAAEGLTRAIVEVYTGPVGMEAAYTLPPKIGNHRYRLEIVNDTRQGVLIYVSDTRCGTSTGGAPFNIKLSGYPPHIRNSGEGEITLYIKNLDAGVNITWIDNCGGCLTIPVFHYNASGNDCFNLNDEYIMFRNTCDTQFNISGWTVRDRIEARPSYTFPDTVLASGSTVTLYTGCGADTVTELYWCSSVYPCNAVWNNDGDTMYLRDPEGSLCMDYSY